MSRSIARACALTIGLACSAAALAAPSLEVNGIVDINGDFVADSFETASSSGTPLVPTSVQVDDALPGQWKYFAAADITVPKLQILGELDNTFGAALGNIEGSLMRVNSSLADTITIAAPVAGAYKVRAELIVDGVLTAAGSDGRVDAQISIDPVDQLKKTVDRVYEGDQTVVDDILPIDFTFTGDAEFDLTSSLFFFVRHVDAGKKITADFSNTAIVKITVTTLGGAIIPDVSITSGSGAFNTAVPLPATLPLMLSALGGLYWRRRAV